LSSKRVFSAVKPEFRVLGVDDGQFTPKKKGEAIVVGVVFRAGKSLEGVMHTHVEVDGSDANRKIAEMVAASPHRRQLRLIMLNGVAVAGFNIVDIAQLHLDTGLPVLAVAQDKPDLAAVKSALKNLPDWMRRWHMVEMAGEIYEVVNCGGKLYVELAGLTLEDAKTVLALTSVRGSLPEPLRVAHLIASGVSP
jgi:endonuclease V-like protein UPF0215 family